MTSTYLPILRRLGGCRWYRVGDEARGAGAKNREDTREGDDLRAETNKGKEGAGFHPWRVGP